MKLKRKNFWKVLSLTLVLSLLLEGIPSIAFAAEENVTPEDVSADGQALLASVSEADILEEESSEYVTAYDLGNGQIAKVFTSYPVRYEDEEGQLSEVDPELVAVDESGESIEGESLSGYAYENKAGAFKQYIPKSLSESTPIILEGEGYSITMTPTGWLNGLLNKNKNAQKKEDESIAVTGESVKKDVTAVFESSSMITERLKLKNVKS